MISGHEDHPIPGPRSWGLAERLSRLWAGRERTRDAAGEPDPLPRHLEQIEPLKLEILIIEDNEDYAEGLQTVFELYGHDAAVASSGAAGLEAALRRPPDVVVCDIGLPEMDGFEIARTLRRTPQTARICLIAVTGYGSDEDRRRVEKAGFDAHLVKPVEAAEILNVIAAKRRSTEGN
jgi:CheY-like chemotaxis protein